MVTHRRLFLALIAGLSLRCVAQAAAEASAVSAAQACRELEIEAQKILGKSGISCEAGVDALTVGGRAADLVQTEKALFPRKIYRGWRVNAGSATAAEGTYLPAKQAVSTVAPAASLKDAGFAVNFDGSGLRASAMLAPAFQQGPPGSGDKPKQGPPGSGSGDKPKQGPPGSGGGDKPKQGPPGSGGGSPGQGGPPGSGGGSPGQGGPPGSGGGTKPPGQTPPSRPAPVWRSHFPPPPPEWWNTKEWDAYDWWSAIPPDYDRPYSHRRDDDTYFYYSGWSMWRTVYSGWGQTTDTATIVRSPQNRDERRTLTSQSYRDAKDCYYRAVYRYEWKEGGFRGSHWEEDFDHWEARCVRRPRQHGQTETATITVSFDMSQAARLPDGSLDLPWQSDSISVSFDGRAITYDFSRAAFAYTKDVLDRRFNDESVRLNAGARRLVGPDANGVRAQLVNEGGVLTLRVSDKWAKYYQGESLEVAVRIQKSVRWRADSVIYKEDRDNPLRWTPNASGTFDIKFTSKKSGEPYRIDGEYYIKSWSFRRANSKVSTGGWIGKGEGNKISN